MPANTLKNETQALRYHAEPKPGKLSVVASKPCETAADLALAYSPGVSEPCLAIARDPKLVYRYTSKGNLVAVISNGTAVLGLGDIGPAASKPVMEGKAVLFKRFADIDVFDLELECDSPEQFIDTVSALGPTFGGVNLEDIKAPECFDIEEALIERLDIPVFHDDQHGTAIIASAALLNALELVGKDLSTIRLVINGAGAAGIACARLLVRLGLPREHIVFCDTKGVVSRTRREGMNRHKLEFAADTTARTLEDAIVDADVFFGLSARDILTPEMLRSMAPSPIVFAMANPDPEIPYELARQTRSDCIIATGRSDYPNQVNNVLGFPFIFRGALDVRASRITEGMKLAAVSAIARLAKEPVPEGVRRAYGNAEFRFGSEYLLPKPFDPRVLSWVAPAVAEAAMKDGVARCPLDLEEYTWSLKAKQNPGQVIVRRFYDIARSHPLRRIGLPEGENSRVLTAAVMAYEERIAEPVLLGKRDRILANAEKLHLDISKLEIVDPVQDERHRRYAELSSEWLNRKGETVGGVCENVYSEHIFACLMLVHGALDGLICGVDRSFSTVVETVVDIVGLSPMTASAAGLHLISVNNMLLFFADTTFHENTTSEHLADTAILSARFAESLGVTPRVALLSFSNFGGLPHPLSSMVRKARDIVRERAPNLLVEGEMQADLAMVPQLFDDDSPSSTLGESPNVLIFPDMHAGNIAFKLLQRVGKATVVGPILLGLNAPAHVLQEHAGVDDIFNLLIIAAAQRSLSPQETLSRLVERERITRDGGDAPLTVGPPLPAQPFANDGLATIDRSLEATSFATGSTSASPQRAHRRG